MNLIKELENILKQPNFMGESDKCGVNLAVNAILDRIDELGFMIVDNHKDINESKKDREINQISLVDELNKLKDTINKQTIIMDELSKVLGLS